MTTMSDPEVVEEILYLSPPEYIKYANARDSRVRHAVELHNFVTYLQTTAGLLREVPEEKVDILVTGYLDEKEES